MPTRSPRECISHDVQGADTDPAISQAHSPPSPATHFAVVEHSPVVVQTDNAPSLLSTAAVAESSSAVNQIEPPHSLDVAFTKLSPEINNAGGYSDVAVAGVSPEINEVDNSLNVTVVNPENSSSTTEPVEIFRFPDLAPEIRDRIYHFVLGPPEDPSICLTQVLDDRPLRAPNGRVDLNKAFRVKSVVQNSEHKDPDWGVIHQVKPDDLSILLVSKQTYIESFHVFYTTNCLYFTDTALLYRFLKNIGYARRQHLTMV